MSHTVYQTTIEVLETVLSPRVVSRSLQEGLKQIGKEPATVAFGDVEKILKAQIYRQLQVSMPVTQAKEKINDILERIRALDPATAREEAATAEAHKCALEELKTALRPFNLYFEWPETQKLRAQLQLLESELAAGKDAAKLVASARAQLQTLQQKLEDQLVIQAKELAELDALFEQVKTLGGPKVRRLENLIGQIHGAQKNRQLATAELERARKLVTDLRKLMESSVVVEAKGAPAEAADGGLLDVESGDDALLSTPGALPPEVSSRLLLLDVENERHELQALAAEFANLLAFRADLAGALEACKARLDRQESLGERLAQLRARLAETHKAVRQELKTEIDGLKRTLAELPVPEDALATSEELAVSLQVTLGVLETTLPTPADVQQVRDLYRLLEKRCAELEQEAAALEGKLEQQSAALAQLQETLRRYRDQRHLPEYEALAEAVHPLGEAQANAQLDPAGLSAARHAQEQLEACVAKSAQAGRARERTLVRSLLNQLQALPQLDLLRGQILAIQEELHRQLSELEKRTLGEAQISSAEALVSNLKRELRAAYQRQLSHFAERATALPDRQLLGRIQEAALALDENDYPDLDDLERALRHAFERRRAGQLEELHQLEAESRPYESLKLPEGEPLNAFLKEARARLDQGLLAELERAWALLERLRTTLSERLTSFEPRLDAAIAAFEPLSKLNSEETGVVQRILKHLSGQREAFYRVSPHVQAQLEAALREAETLIEHLNVQYEATRAIAGQLVNDNVLDELLGFFSDSPSSRAKASPPAPTLPSATEVRSDSQALNRWLDDYLVERGVRGAVTFSEDGKMVAGRLHLEPPALYGAIKALEHDLGGLSQELRLGKHGLLTLETPGPILVLAWPTPDYRIALVLDAPPILSLILSKLRRNLPELIDILSGPALA